MSRDIEVSATRAAGWQPEHAAAPGGASAGPAAKAGPIDARRRTAAVSKRVRVMSKHSAEGGRRSAARIQTFFKSWFFSGSERMRLPVAAKIALHSAGATTATGGSPTPPQKPPLGTMTVSTLGICASRSIW